MEENNISTNRELRELANDRRLSELTLNAEKEKIANMLKGDMGKDMEEVLSGKKIVKLSIKEKFIYKLNKWIDLFFNAF